MKVYLINLKRKHPKGTMRLGRHLISYKKEKYMLNTEEIDILDSNEALHWFDVELVKRKKRTSKKGKENGIN